MESSANNVTKAMVVSVAPVRIRNAGKIRQAKHGGQHMRRFIQFSITALILVFIEALTGGVASADSVVYTFTGTTLPGAGPQHTESFQFTAPGFITSATDLSASELNSCTACALSGTTVQFFPNGTASLIVPADFIRFTDADGIVYGYFFAPGDFSAPGSYTGFNDPPVIVSDIGTLTVQEVPEISPHNAMTPLAFLFGSVLIIRGRKRTQPDASPL